jgi:hypothetical protein
MTPIENMPDSLVHILILIDRYDEENAVTSFIGYLFSSKTLKINFKNAYFNQLNHVSEKFLIPIFVGPVLIVLQ